MKTVLKIFTLLLVGVLVAGSPVKNGHEVGDEATSFDLKNIDGKSISMKDYADEEGIILVFTCNTCPYSKMYEQRIIDLQTAYVDKGYPVVAINSNDPMKSPGDSFDEMVSLAKEKSYNFPYLYDADQSIAKAYGATNTPHVYLLNRNKDKFYISYIGAIDNNARSGADADKKYVESAIDALKNGREVNETSTKAIGCTIKWKAS
jgi:peroxiredoxin